MDDMRDDTPSDPTEGMPEVLKRLLGLVQPDPAEMRAHYLGHLTDDIGLDQETAVRLLDIAESLVLGAKRDDTPTGDDMRDYIIRMSLAQGLKGQLAHAFDGIHFAETQGVPVPSVLDLDHVRECLTQFLAAWDKCVTDAVEVEVPDDISALVE